MTSFDNDAGPEVAAANQFNESPVPGRRFVMARIEAAYDGPEQQAAAWLDMSFGAVGPSNVGYGQDYGRDNCGVIPNALDETNDVFQGGTVTGNVCWAVEEGDIEQLVMTVEDYASFDGGLTFFDLSR